MSRHFSISDEKGTIIEMHAGTEEHTQLYDLVYQCAVYRHNIRYTVNTKDMDQFDYYVASRFLAEDAKNRPKK
jgi:hypothetical protein